MAGTPDNNPGGGYKSQFSKDQIDRALNILQENPNLIEALITSAQGGNQGDLRFIMELGDRGVSLSFDDRGGFIHRARE